MCRLVAGNCRPRVCTQHGFCGTLVQASVPDLAAVLLGGRSLKQAGIRIEHVRQTEVQGAQESPGQADALP